MSAIAKRLPARGPARSAIAVAVLLRGKSSSTSSREKHPRETSVPCFRGAGRHDAESVPAEIRDEAEKGMLSLDRKRLLHRRREQAAAKKAPNNGSKYRCS